ncbi:MULTISPECIES: NAD(P)-dependent oxidoreductase [Sphingobium]|uniref:NAD(P)-dependent oxidoreductase n=1 Tax=Sphingobium sp. MI1205 TaxID=407020 RepID=UPI0007702485|nr:hypothetical protein K663_03375 [Sphingobium sp. MI1205]
MLMSLYDIEQAQARLRRGVTRRGPPTACMLKGKTVGIIGFGDIARALPARLSGSRLALAGASRRLFLCRLI